MLRGCDCHVNREACGRIWGTWSVERPNEAIAKIKALVERWVVYMAETLETEARLDLRVRVV